MRPIAIVLFILFLLLVACTNDENQASVPAPGTGDELRLLRNTEPAARLDPHLANLQSDLILVKQVLRGLLWYDEKLNLVPMAAKEVPSTSNGGISSDGLIYTFKLRDDLKWSDGSALTAQDFEYSFKRLLDPALKSPRATPFHVIQGAERYNTCKECPASELLKLRDEVGVRALNDRTLVINLRNPRSSFPYLLPQPAASPVQRAAIEAYGDAWTDPGNYVGNGPFVLASWTKGEQLVFEANPHWWGKKSELKRLTIKIIGDPAKGIEAYRNGELDVVDLQPDSMLSVSEDPVLSTELTQIRALTTYVYFFNNSQPPFDNKLVRQAFSMAVDREAYTTNVQKGGAVAGYSWVPAGMPGYDNKLGQKWKFNPSKARALLSDAGYPGAVGLPKITYVYNTSIPQNKEDAEFLQTQLERNLGVSIEIKPMEIGPWREELNGRRLQVILLGFPAPFSDAEAMLEVWTCQKYSDDKCLEYGGNNLWSYSNPNFDRLMLQAGKESDTKRRLELYAKAQAIIEDDSPSIVMSHRIRNVLVKPYVRDLQSTPLDVLPAEFRIEYVRLSGTK